jgi:hypothetical protein
MLREWKKKKKQRRGTFGRPPLTVEQILSWVDAHHELTGAWPKKSDGLVHGAFDETWPAIHNALRQGLRGLPGGSSLARLLVQYRGVNIKLEHPPLTEEEILAWADAHRGRTGEWPQARSGPITEAPTETWMAISWALEAGGRGLPGGSSLARLLAERRGKRNGAALPPLTVERIIRWADAHHARTGEWPRETSGLIADAAEETWSAIGAALRGGFRGMPGGSSLPRLLAEHRGVFNKLGQPPLTEERILAWADAHRESTGELPTTKSGPIADPSGGTWVAVDSALRTGVRGLPGGSSLSRLLAERRGGRKPAALRPLTVEGILVWADAHRARTGEWPSAQAGPILDAPQETWGRAHKALRRGGRGLPGGSSLPRLLAERRGVRWTRKLTPGLGEEQILLWIDAHRARTGEWPVKASGPIPECLGQTWLAADAALQKGHHGLPGGSSLARLLAERRGVRNKTSLPPFTVEQILAWADAHHDRTGAWPHSHAGLIAGTAEETWVAVGIALRLGHRGLPGGSSLHRLLAEHRGVRPIGQLLRVEQILHWADAHHRRTGKWPKQGSGPILDAESETWGAVDATLRLGLRGMPGGSSLVRLLREHGRMGKIP